MPGGSTGSASGALQDRHGGNGRRASDIVRETFSRSVDLVDRLTPELGELAWQAHPEVVRSVRPSLLAGLRLRAIATVTFDEAGRREIALRGRPEKLEVSRTFAHLFKPS